MFCWLYPNTNISIKQRTQTNAVGMQDWQQLARTILPLLERVGRSNSLDMPGVSMASVTALAKKVQGYLIQPVLG